MSSYFDLTGRSALVTGAAGGIASAVAAALADAGAAVLVTDLDKDAAAAVAERISANGNWRPWFIPIGRPNTSRSLP